MQDIAPDLAGSADRLRWNARYRGRPRATFVPHPLAVQALAQPPPDGPVLELASGPSGTALLAAAAGRRVTAVDVSEVALALLAAEARRRGLADLVTPVHADLARWRPEPGRYALVLCTGYWDRGVFAAAVTAVSRGGLLGWEAFRQEACRARPGLDPGWCLRPGEPACLLPASFMVADQHDLPGCDREARRRMLARRRITGRHG